MEMFHRVGSADTTTLAYKVDATLGAHTLRKKHVVVLNGQTARATFIFPAGTD